MTTPFSCDRASTNPAKQAKTQPLSFSVCCDPYLNENAAVPAPDAESLVRSRYSAFVLGSRDYLLATWHSSTPPRRPCCAGAGRKMAARRALSVRGNQPAQAKGAKWPLRVPLASSQSMPKACKLLRVALARDSRLLTG